MKEGEKQAGACITAGMKRDRTATEKIKEEGVSLDLTSLVEQHAKETWALKEQLSEASKELTVLRGTKGVVTQLSNELVRMKKTKLIPMTEEEEYRNAGITKAEIGMNSPEMKEAKERIKELQIRLAEALEVDEAHQKQMGKLQASLTETEEDNKKLSHQIEDLKMNHRRKAGF